MAVFGNAEEAEDLTPESFLRLYSALVDGQVVRNVRFWIFKVAHNLAINRRKHNKFILPMNADSWDELLAMLPDVGLTPEQDILRREKFSKLFSGIMNPVIKTPNLFVNGKTGVVFHNQILTELKLSIWFTIARITH